jgi:hypothetical protein
MELARELGARWTARAARFVFAAVAVADAA